MTVRIGLSLIVLCWLGATTSVQGGFLQSLGQGAAPDVVLAANAPMGKYEYGPIGAPTGGTTPDKPLRMEVTVIVNGQPVKKPVAVGNIEKVKQPVFQEKGFEKETRTEFNKRVWDTYAAASRKKATAIAEAINKAFEAEFKMLGEKVETSTLPDKTVVAPRVEYTAEFGSLIIPGVSREMAEDLRNPAIKIQEPGVDGERRNRGRYLPGSSGSMGMKSTMGISFPTELGFAEGYDLLGNPSVVEFGIEEQYVARFTPEYGMNEVETLKALEFLLNENGIAARFDPSLLQLILLNPIPDSQRVFWGNSDPGLNFFVTFQGASLAVPEPSSFGLAAIGLLTVLAVARRLRRTRATAPGPPLTPAVP